MRTQMTLLLLSFFIGIIPSRIFGLTALEIIRKADNNNISQTEKFAMTMIIEKDKKKLVKTFTGVGKKEGDKFFMEFTNPEDKGVKYLKIKDELWIYLPDADDIMKISGHLLRQGMMGSDISYEDLLNLDKLEEQYSAVLLGDITYEGAPCYKIECIAKKADVTYYKKILIIDKEKFVLWELELFAKSGRLLKKMFNKNVQVIQGRNYPMQTIIQDMRKKNSLTTVNVNRIELDAVVSERSFSRANLKR